MKLALWPHVFQRAGAQKLWPHVFQRVRAPGKLTRSKPCRHRSAADHRPTSITINWSISAASPASTDRRNSVLRIPCMTVV